MRKLVIPALLVASVLLARRSNATSATMVWTEVASTVEGCATSISVGPNNVPWVIGCGSAADEGIFYLDTQPGNTFNNYFWHQVTGSAKQVSLNRDGVPFVLDSKGNVYAALTHSPYNQYSNIFQWKNITSTPQTCISRIAAGENNSFSLVGLTPAETGSGDIELLSLTDNFQNEFIYGLGCTALDQYSDRSILSWNWSLTDGPVATNEIWNASPGWLQIDSGSSAAQIALFNGSGSTNPQVPWVLTGAGGVFAFDGLHFHQPPAEVTLEQSGWFVLSLTDHYIDAVNLLNDVVGIFQWSDQQQSWTPYISGTTPQNTEIVEIAASQPIQTAGNGTFGPSQLWGLDHNGHIFYASESGGLQ
jgi:hypothetical protein